MIFIFQIQLKIKHYSNVFLKVCVDDKQFFFVQGILYLLDNKTNGYEEIELI